MVETKASTKRVGTPPQDSPAIPPATPKATPTATTHRPQTQSSQLQEQQRKKPKSPNLIRIIITVCLIAVLTAQFEGLSVLIEFRCQECYDGMNVTKAETHSDVVKGSDAEERIVRGLRIVNDVEEVSVEGLDVLRDASVTGTNITTTCTSSKVGAMGQTVVYGKKISYCYPLRGKFQKFLNIKPLENEPPNPETKQNTERPPKKIIFLLTSAQKNSARRDAIRNAWGMKTWVFFVVSSGCLKDGTDSNEECSQVALADEMEEHGDLILVDAPLYKNGTDRLMASLHAVQSHLVNKEKKQKSTIYGHIFKGTDNIHVNVKRYLEATIPHYYGICITYNLTKETLSASSAGIYPSRLHRLDAGKNEIMTLKTAILPGMPEVVASSAGYAMSSEFVDCILKRTAAKQDGDNNGLEESGELHEDAVVALLAKQCNYRCANWDNIKRYASDLIVQHRVKTKTEMAVLYQHYDQSGQV